MSDASMPRDPFDRWERVGGITRLVSIRSGVVFMIRQAACSPSDAPAFRTRPGLGRAAFLVGLLFLSVVNAGAAQERILLTSRQGVTEAVDLTVTRPPAASVILFTGNNGVVAATRNNFLLRVAPDFARSGLTVAIVDVPSDHASGLNTEFRASAEHAADIAAVVALLKSRAGVPVWLIGTSAGSISAANGAARIGPPGVTGAVLTSSPWLNGMAAAGLDRIRVPVLIVHNRDDACRASPFSQAPAMIELFRGAKLKELMPFSGGASLSDPCQARSPHGYYGIENQVVPAIVSWIKAH